MNIEWIGTGAGLNPTLGNTSFLIREGDRTLLVDCGYTVPPALLQKNCLKDISHIVITHQHADHMGGLEALGFMNYFAYRKRGDKRPVLYVATDELAHSLWHASLKGGMQKIQDDEGNPEDATLETFFRVKIGKNIDLPGLQPTFFLNNHVQGMESYGLRFANGVFYSGDTTDLPPHDPSVIFQDVQFFEGKGDVHVSYDKLLKELPPSVRRKVHLVHLGNTYQSRDPKKDGFAGYVMPGDQFFY